MIVYALSYEDRVCRPEPAAVLADLNVRNVSCRGAAASDEGASHVLAVW